MSISKIHQTEFEISFNILSQAAKFSA